MGHTLLVPVATPAAEALVPAPPLAPDAGIEARSALLRALALAAGIDDARRDIGQYIVLPPMAELRTPVAKRGLWPRLRALRKTPPA